MTVTPLGRDQDCSLKNREPDVRLSWFLDPGGWGKAAAVGLYFIFPGICTLSLNVTEMCWLSWFLDPGGWGKAAAVGLYFIFPGICTLSLSPPDKFLRPVVSGVRAMKERVTLGSILAFAAPGRGASFRAEE
ncbi:hypothetical protein STEG23_010431 [Scotinomys teguina]